MTSLSSLVITVCNEIDQWPPPVPGLTLNLPVMGVVLQVSVAWPVEVSLSAFHVPENETLDCFFRSVFLQKWTNQEEVL